VSTNFREKTSKRYIKIIRDLGEDDSWKKTDAKNLVTLSLYTEEVLAMRDIE
jgi:hypothetical protein